MKSDLALTVVLLMIVTGPITATADDLPLAHDPTLLSETVLTIAPERVQDWFAAGRGSKLSLPWRDETELEVVVDRVVQQDKRLTLHGTTAANVVGPVVLSLEAGRLTGVVSIDHRSFRLRTAGEDTYLLMETNAELLHPNGADSEESAGLSGRGFHRREFRRVGLRLDRLPPRKLKRLFEVELTDTGNRHLFETGSRIDVLVAYTLDAAQWAQNEGVDIDGELAGMFGVANFLLGASGVVPDLNLVGVAQVDHKVQDAALLKTDLFSLAAGTGNLSVLHDLRDVYGADLVVLLVLNGTGPCGVDLGQACGRAFQAQSIAGPNNVPGSNLWESQFASRGFGVMGMYAAFNGFTFLHEVGHMLGAHHDKYTHQADQSAATADTFARGWILAAVPARTLMSYRRLCDIINLDCPLVPVFSDPLQTYLGVIRGDPAPGQTPTNFGPADNSRAINRMASTVASYRFAP